MNVVGKFGRSIDLLLILEPGVDRWDVPRCRAFRMTYTVILMEWITSAFTLIW